MLQWESGGPVIRRSQVRLPTYFFLCSWWLEVGGSRTIYHFAEIKIYVCGMSKL